MNGAVYKFLKRRNTHTHIKSIRTLKVMSNNHIKEERERERASY